MFTIFKQFKEYWRPSDHYQKERHCHQHKHEYGSFKIKQKVYHLTLAYLHSFILRMTQGHFLIAQAWMKVSGSHGLRPILWTVISTA